MRPHRPVDPRPTRPPDYRGRRPRWPAKPAAWARCRFRPASSRGQKQRKKQGEQRAHRWSAYAHNSHGTKSAPWLGVGRREARLNQNEAVRTRVAARSDRRPIAGSSRLSSPSSAARLNSANRWPGSGLAPVRPGCEARSAPVRASPVRGAPSLAASSATVGSRGTSPRPRTLTCLQHPDARPRAGWRKCPS